MERAQLLLQFLYSKFYLYRISGIKVGISCSEFEYIFGLNSGINQSEFFNDNSEARSVKIKRQIGGCREGNSYKQMTAGVCLSVRKDGELAQSRWMKILSLSGFLSSDRF